MAVPFSRSKIISQVPEVPEVIQAVDRVLWLTPSLVFPHQVPAFPLCSAYKSKNT